LDIDGDVILKKRTSSNKKDPNFAVIFDMDGVIVRSSPFHKRAWTIFFQKYKLRPSKDELHKHVHGRTNAEILNYLFGKKKNMTLTREQVYEYAEEKESIYRQAFKNYIRPTQGLAEFLKLLEKHKIRKAIATSGPPKNVDFVLAELGLKKYFKTILTDKHVKKGKPHPEVFLKAAKALKMKPEDCIVFEDSLAGIKAAQRAGMKVIALSTTHKKSEIMHADRVFRNFKKMDIRSIEKIIRED
jgi:beta-phosphoglucomutase family hydrolase